MSESDSNSLFGSDSGIGHEHFSNEEHSSDDGYIEGELVEKKNNNLDPLDILYNEFFVGQIFSSWCEFSPCADIFSDNHDSVISPMVFAETKEVKIDFTRLNSLSADDVDSCDRMYWIIRNCFHLEKLILHDQFGDFGIQKLFSLWAKPNKLRCEKLDKFELHFNDYEGQIEDKDYFVSFLVSNIKFLKELKLNGSNFGDQRALEFAEKVFQREPVGESKFSLADDKITVIGLKELLKSPWVNKCKHIELEIDPSPQILEALIHFFMDPKKELDVKSFTLSSFSIFPNHFEMRACHHIELSTALYFHPKVTAFKISGFAVTYDKGYDDLIKQFEQEKDIVQSSQFK